MRDSEKNNSCIYNLLYVKFNEDIGRENYFSYNLQYPAFYNFKNTYFHVDAKILDNINSTIKEDVYDFKNGLLEEEQESNNASAYNALPYKHYKVIVNYAVTFNKNHILSTILNFMGFAGDYGPRYNQINNYNFDLLTGNTVSLKDIFKPEVNYIKLLTNYVNYKINQNKSWYYPDVNIEISDNQAFYLTDDGIVIYFDLDQIAPSEFGIPKFKLSFEKFAAYMNPRFYCSAENIAYRKKHRSSRR
ncbi:MAG: DUF3298 domain-containing protein [Romboutsia sp.]|uniref:DUF3298 and DUF4163 domain-containing protein n=1 Tax=Romboutsia sp. TaxID=1965302 RepID=UPI003F2E547B